MPEWPICATVVMDMMITNACRLQHKIYHVPDRQGCQSTSELVQHRRLSNRLSTEAMRFLKVT